MQRRTLFASLGLALAGLTAGWALDGRGQVISDAAAVEQTYGRGFFAGDPHLWNSSSGSFDASLIGFATGHVARKLDLDQAQEAQLDDLVKAATTTYEQARSDPAFDRERISTLTPPEQLSAMRTLARKADNALAEIEAPLAAFHASLDARQQQKLAELMAEHRGRNGERSERGGWWHRRG